MTIHDGALAADARKTKAELLGDLATLRNRLAELERTQEIDKITTNIADAVVTISARGEIQSFNPAAENMFGFDPAEVIGENVSVLMPEPDHGKHDGYIHAYLETGKGKILGIGPREVTARRKDGSTFPLELTVGEMKLGNEPVFIGAMRDITERKQMDEQLRRNEERLRRLTASLPLVITYLDSELRYRYANKTHLDWHGLRFDEVKGKTVTEFLGEAAMEVMGPHLATALSGETVTFEAEIQYATVGKRYVLANFVPDLDADGNVVGIYASGIDLTDRERGERALRESEAKFRSLVEGSLQGIVITDTERKLLFVNQAVCDIFGYDGPDEMLSLSSTSELAVLEDGIKIANYAEARQRGEETPNHYEFRGVGKDGKELWLDVLVTVINWDGEWALQATIVDITESRRADKEAREIEEKYRSLVELSPDGILVHQNGTIVFANPAAVKLYRAEGPEQLVGRKIVDLVHPDDRQEMLARRRALKRGERLEVSAELRRLRLDGTYFIGEAIGANIPWDGGEATILVIRDNTERKQEQQSRQRAEDRLRDAIDSIADGLVLFDANDRVVMWNQRFVDMYPELAAMLPNEPTAEDMFRERYRVGAVGDFDVSAEEYVRWRIEMRRKQGGTPAVHRHSDGRWFRTTERRTTEGGVVAISTDVTELKSSELDQRNAKQQAELASRSKSEFLANMSHELRTPLNAVIGFSEMIMGGVFGPVGNAKYLEYAKDINASGQHLLAIINDILDLSKIEAGKLELYEQVVDVTEVLNDSVTLVKERMEEGALSLETYFSEGLPTIIADQVKVKQALINLLSNAVKFTGPGGTISIHAYVETDGDLAIQIADTGIGIAAEDFHKLMEPFGQADGGLSRRYQGTGLGLPLSKALIELHEGTLVLESELGVGTTVTIRFPAERVRDCAV